MRHSLATSVMASIALASAASAAQLTTLFASNNGGSAGGGVYFQIVVGANPINVTGFATNTSATAGTSVPLRVWTAPITHVGNEANAGAWTFVASGLGISAGTDQPTNMTMSNSFALAANTSYGIALSLSSAAGGTSFAHRYSGTGTNPAPGALQYSNSDITLNLGTATNVLFSGTPFSPRIWNGTIIYDVVPSPGAAGLFAVAGIACARRRR